MEQSILTSTKKILGLSGDYTAFDLDVITHINTAFSILTQLGIGPPEGFMIEDDTIQWDDILGDDFSLNMVRTYVYLKVRTIFDPPTTRYTIGAIDNQIKELEGRLSMHRESISWVTPFPIKAKDLRNRRDISWPYTNTYTEWFD